MRADESRRHQAQRIAVMMKMKRINRTTIRKVVCAVAGAGLLAIVLASGPAALAQVDNTQAAPTTAPSNATRLVADGLTPDGKVKLIVNKTTVLTTTRPYNKVSVGNSDVADVNLVSPTSILVTAKKSGSTQLILFDDKGQTQVADVVISM